jgi:DnaK suppressor protein
MKEIISKTATNAGGARKRAAPALPPEQQGDTVSLAASPIAPTGARKNAAAGPTAAAAASRTGKRTAPAARPRAGAGSEETVPHQAVTAAGSSAHTHAVPGVTAELADKMETSVVSKVSEVMTKTTKPNTPVQSEDRLLTEEEIRAMSDDDYMNPAQLAFFKNRLQELERELLKNAGETTEHLRETVLVPDPADRATIEEEHALELRTRDRERKLLKKVQQSLASIEAGEYGWCEETGEPIGIPRLIARPTATLSLEAQQRRELKQKLYGD